MLQSVEEKHVKISYLENFPQYWNQLGSHILTIRTISGRPLTWPMGTY